MILSIEQIDGEIRALQEQIRQLRSTRNTVVPIGKIPAEVAIRVFSLAMAASEDPKTLLRLTWVSRRWREVAIGFPAFWNRVDSANRRWMLQCWRRSQDTPLSVSLRLHGNYSQDPLPLMDGLPQMKHLVLVRTAHPDNATAVPASDYWARPAPRLETLALSGYEVPPQLFSGDAPRLHNLALRACHFGWTILARFPDLTTLKLLEPGRTIMLRTLTDRLSMLPNLQSLSLQWVVDEDDEGIISNTGAIVSLPHLSEFYFADSLSALRNLLPQLSFPSTANVILHAEAMIFDAGEFGLLLNAALGHCAQLPPIEALAIVSEIRRTFAVHFSRSGSWPTRDDHFVILVNRDIHSEEYEWPESEELMEIVSTMPFFQTARRLALAHEQGDTEYDAEDGVTLKIAHFPALEHVQLSRWASTSFLCALNPSALPLLRNLVLQHVEFEYVNQHHFDALDQRRIGGLQHARLVLSEREQREAQVGVFSAFDEVTAPDESLFVSFYDPVAVRMPSVYDSYFDIFAI